MFKKIFALALVAFLINLVGMNLAYAESKEEKQARFTEKVRKSVLKLGTGEAARVKVKLHDKTKVEGYVSVSDDSSFIVTNAKTGATTALTYTQVKSVNGNNLSTGAKIAIGAGIAVAVFFIIFYKVVVDDD